MSSWDRREVLEDYAARFDAREDHEALIEELGTPTRVAYLLAQSYVPTPPPGTEPEEPVAAVPETEQEPASLDSLLEELSEEEFFGEEPPSAPEPETAAEEPSAEPAPTPAAIPEPAPSAPNKRNIRPGGLVGFLALCLVPGLPVAALLIVLGLPFLGLGIFGMLFLLTTLRQGLAVYRLWSDSLLLTGGCLAAFAVCLLLCWLGLWISISLCRIWIRDVMVPWGRRMIVSGEGD